MKLKPFIKQLLLILLFIYLYDTIGISKTLLGYFIGFLILFIYRAYHHRALFMAQLRNLETKTFGKPLDRDQWKPGEIKTRKVKIVWKVPQETKGGTNGK